MKWHERGFQRSQKETEQLVSIALGECPVYDQVMNLFIDNAAVPFLCVAAVCSCCTADDFVRVAVVEDKRISESSGLAISHANPNAIWIHNDSGDKPRLFLVGLDGVTQAVVEIAGADAHDWEDLCSFKINGESWLLIGDVGDNLTRRGNGHPACRLYLLKEPVVPAARRPAKIQWNVSATITFAYENGPANCEGVAVDVEREEILLLTKSLPHKCELYRLPLNTRAGRQKTVAKRIADVFIPFATALDISPDGRTMVVCTMLNGLSVTRVSDRTWTDALGKPGTAFNLPPRKQGETICFDTTGRWLYVNSEGSRQPLWRMNTPK
ncbi:MAG: hypothetical protein GY758_03455 [Fuerstiella sp.]|nr:hypothetical protein [Fuerstiella sp.]MCP4787597.1 hypothetical protein [Fuerstiella sp.]